ncbi:hypothetical protein JCM5353_006021 [Sporobolomyces roseus]
MIYESKAATASHLFADMNAFFSPRIPPATKVAWCHYGGRTATLNTADSIQMYFGAYSHHCDLIQRLRAIDINVIDESWIMESIKHQQQVNIEPFLFSTLETSNESGARNVNPIPDRSTQDQASVERISQGGEEIEGDSSDSDSADEVARLLLSSSSYAQASPPITQASQPASLLVKRFLPQRILKMHSRTFIVSTQSSHAKYETRSNSRTHPTTTQVSSISAGKIEIATLHDKNQPIPASEHLPPTVSPQHDHDCQLAEQDPVGQEVGEPIDDVTNSRSETEIVDSQCTSAVTKDVVSVEHEKTEDGMETISQAQEMTTPKVTVSLVESRTRSPELPALSIGSGNDSSPTQPRDFSTPSLPNPEPSDVSPLFASLFSAQLQSHTSPSTFPIISAETLLSSLASTLPPKVDRLAEKSIRDGLCLMDHGKNGFKAKRRAGVTGSRDKRKSEGETSKTGEGKKKRLK